MSRKLHPLYRVWDNMRRRCEVPSHPQFIRYGGRGITVAAEFQASADFIEWALSNGWKHGVQLDRKDNDGPYSALNCRFVSRAENMRNQSRTVRLPNGETTAAFAERYGLSRALVIYRLRAGWPIERMHVPPFGRRTASP